MDRNKIGTNYWLDKEIETIEPLIQEQIMVVSAHPDDVESECAGTLALCKESRSIIKLLIATGDTHSEREREAKNAANIIGIDEVQFLHFPDGKLENTIGLKEQIVKYIRLWKPNIVFTYDPDFSLPLYVSHPDHRAIGRATLDAVFPLARDKKSFTELSLEPHIVKTVWLFGSANATKYIDIKSTLKKKFNQD